MRTKTVTLGGTIGALGADQRAGYVFAGAGTALSVLSAGTGGHLIDVNLPGLPQAMAVEEMGSRLFLAVPGPGLIVVGDRASRRKVGQWTLEGYPGSVALALDEPRRRLFVASPEGGATAAIGVLRPGPPDGEIPTGQR